MSITQAMKITGHARSTYKKHVKIWFDFGKPGIKKYANSYDVSKGFVNWMIKNVPVRKKSGK